MLHPTSEKLPARWYKPELLKRMTTNHMANLAIVDEMFPTSVDVWPLPEVTADELELGLAATIPANLAQWTKVFYRKKPQYESMVRVGPVPVAGHVVGGNSKTTTLHINSMNKNLSATNVKGKRGRQKTESKPVEDDGWCEVSVDVPVYAVDFVMEGGRSTLGDIEKATRAVIWVPPPGEPMVALRVTGCKKDVNNACQAINQKFSMVAASLKVCKFVPPKQSNAGTIAKMAFPSYSDVATSARFQCERPQSNVPNEIKQMVKPQQTNQWQPKTHEIYLPPRHVVNIEPRKMVEMEKATNTNIEVIHAKKCLILKVTGSKKAAKNVRLAVDKMFARTSGSSLSTEKLQATSSLPSSAEYNASTRQSESTKSSTVVESNNIVTMFSAVDLAKENRAVPEMTSMKINYASAPSAAKMPSSRGDPVVQLPIAERGVRLFSEVAARQGARINQPQQVAAIKMAKLIKQQINQSTDVSLPRSVVNMEPQKIAEIEKATNTKIEVIHAKKRLLLKVTGSKQAVKNVRLTVDKMFAGSVSAANSIKMSPSNNEAGSVAQLPLNRAATRNTRKSSVKTVTSALGLNNVVFTHGGVRSKKRSQGILVDSTNLSSRGAKVCVTNLANEVTVLDLEEEFQPCGRIRDLKIEKYETGRLAIIEFLTKKAADVAEFLDGDELRGQKICVRALLDDENMQELQIEEQIFNSMK